MHKRTFTRAVGVLCLFVSFALVPGQFADAATAVKNPRAEQERVRREKAAAAEQLNTLKASAKELQDALAVLDENLRQEEAALEAAQHTVDTETQAAEALRVQEQAANDKLAALDRLLVENAIDAYMSPDVDGDLFSMSSSNINEAVRKQALFDLTNTKNRDAADQVKAVRADLERLEAQRNAAIARAQAARADVAARLTVVDAARAEQEKFVEAADDRVDHALNELKALESLDKQLAAQIEAELRALAAQAEKARRASTAAKPFTPPASGDIVNVQGIWIHRSIAAGLNSLLNAAAAAGVDLGGSGYRDSSGQIALRRANCGSSDYAVYQMDPFKCRPPTARPGTSNHERGMAVDFTVNGGVLTRSSKAFQWMSANAGKYGFYNLPSEPWHWSSDGK